MKIVVWEIRLGNLEFWIGSFFDKKILVKFEHYQPYQILEGFLGSDRDCFH